MKQCGFYVDSSRCSGCKTCQVSCKDNKDLDVGPKLRRVYEYGGGSWVKEGESWHHDTFTYYLSIACNHCDEPVCVSGCPTGRCINAKKMVWSWWMTAYASAVAIVKCAAPTARRSLIRRQT